MKFPLYRKYLNGVSFFRIDSLDQFEEIRKIGSRYLVTEHQVKILPERNMLHDLIHDYAAFAVEIAAEEYESIAEAARTTGKTNR